MFSLDRLYLSFVVVCSKYASLHVYAKHGCPTVSVAKGSCYDVSRVCIMLPPTQEPLMR